MRADKTIVLGLDGAHFELIQPWIEAGELPNLRRAIEGGVTADLQSVLPPVTSPNWKAYATGKNPGKLGIFWWENVDMEEELVYYPDERKSAHVEFWEIIGHQASAGVVNVPTTYPPRQVEPFIIAGAPDAASSGYTYPPDLEGEITDQLDYRVSKETPIRANPEAAADEIVDLIDLRFRTGKYLLEKYDPEFLQITTFYLNSLHHYFWDRKETLEGWKTIDHHLGDLLNNEYNVVLMSDHGSTEIETVFHINTWLENEGYLVSNMGSSKILGKLGITTDRLVALSTKLGIRDLAKRLVPTSVIDRIPSEEGEVRRESKTENVDWGQTTALASGQGPVYIDKQRGDYDRIRTELIEKLSNLTGPTGNPIAESVYRGEEVYSGPYLGDAPDVVIDQADGIHIQGGLGRDTTFTDPQNDGWKGENKQDGLFVANGPDFSSGTLGDISVLDLAPTLLHLHDCDIPNSFDGEVKKGVYDRQTPVLQRDISYKHLSSEGQSFGDGSEVTDINERLQDLGYFE